MFAMTERKARLFGFVRSNVKNMLTRRRILPAHVVGAIIDIETTGLPSDGAELITLGAVSGNRLFILQRTQEYDFSKVVQNALAGLTRPFYAFNKGFEEAMLGIKIDGELQAKSYEKKSDAIAVALLHDPFDGEGIQAINAWNDFKRTGDKEYLLRIMDHNESDLLLETCLLLVRHSQPEYSMVKK